MPKMTAKSDQRFYKIFKNDAFREILSKSEVGEQEIQLKRLA